MKRSIVVPIVAAMVFLAAVPQASAATFWIKSKVVDVNTATNYLKLYRLNEQTDTVEEIKVGVDASTQFQGFDSLLQLTPGDEVSVQVNFSEFHSEYQALLIGLSATARRGPRFVTAPPPNFSPALVSGGARLFQNAIEEKPNPITPKKAGQALTDQL